MSKKIILVVCGKTEEGRLNTPEDLEDLKKRNKELQEIQESLSGFQEESRKGAKKIVAKKPVYGVVSTDLAGLILQESLRKGKTISIPSLGIEIKP